MWFKNCYIYKLETPLTNIDSLVDYKFKGCANTEKESLGWVNPLGVEEDYFVHSVSGSSLLTLMKQVRLLPTSVVNEEVNKQIKKIEAEQSRKVQSKEKKDIKENVEFDLLPKSFTRNTKIDAWFTDEYLIINTASANVAEMFCDQLRKAIGSVPVELLNNNNLTIDMTYWVQNELISEEFVFNDEIELVSHYDDKSKATFKHHEIISTEVLDNIENDKYVSKLGMIWKDKISFILDENYQLKRIKFLDVCKDQLDDYDAQSKQEQLDIEFSIMSTEIDLLITNLLLIGDK